MFTFLLAYQSVSTMGDKIHFLYVCVGLVCIISFILVQAVLIYFLIKYVRRKGEPLRKTPFITHNTVLEVIWTLVPTIILLFMLYYGSVYFIEMRTLPKDAMTIEVVAKQWSWTYTYPQVTPAIAENSQNYCSTSATYTGAPPVTPTDCKKMSFEWKEGASLKVPVNTKVILKMTSTDVLHSFFIPSFEVKQDVLPKQYSYLWFEATKVGKYPVYCAEYCGTDHSGMVSYVEVMEQSDFTAWLESGGESSGKSEALSTEELVTLGKELYQAKGCVACHRIDGTNTVGPHLNKKYGIKESLVDGSSILVDDNYIMESIKDPSAKVVKGFGPVMPLSSVNDIEIKALVEFIKSIK